MISLEVQCTVHENGVISGAVDLFAFIRCTVVVRTNVGAKCLAAYINHVDNFIVDRKIVANKYPETRAGNKNWGLSSRTGFPFELFNRHGARLNSNYLRECFVKLHNFLSLSGNYRFSVMAQEKISAHHFREAWTYYI